MTLNYVEAVRVENLGRHESHENPGKKNGLKIWGHF